MGLYFSLSYFDAGFEILPYIADSTRPCREGMVHGKSIDILACDFERGLVSLLELLKPEGTPPKMSLI
jgi:hypothetical protein